MQPQAPTTTATASSIGHGWHVDKTINPAFLATVCACAFAAISWGNGVDGRVGSLESGQITQRAEASQVRAELMQAQTQQRIEANQQFTRLESKIESEIRELRNTISNTRALSR